MNPPHRELDPGRFERFPPREDVLVHAVHQRPVEIENEDGRLDGARLGPVRRRPIQGRTIPAGLLGGDVVDALEELEDGVIR